MIKIINKISSFDKETICFIWHKFFKILSIVGIGLFAIGLVIYFEDFTSFLTLSKILIFISIILYIFVDFVNFIVKLSIKNILHNCIDLDKYIYCTKFICNNSKSDLSYPRYLRSLAISEATVLYYRGEFENALNKLNKLDIKKFKRLKLEYYNIHFKINLFLGNFDDAKKDIENIELLLPKSKSSRKYKYLKEVVDISKVALKIIAEKKPVDPDELYYENLNRSKLNCIYNELYLNGLNKLLIEDYSGAIEVFKELSKENEELFFVRDAKERLEELYNEKEVIDV